MSARRLGAGRIAYAVLLAAMVVFLGWRVIAAELARRAPPFEGTAAERLSRDPLDGDAFADLAVEMRGTADQAAVLEMHLIAARRDPRDLRIRAWLADHYIRTGEFDLALDHLDIVLRLDPALRTPLLPMIVGLADTPAFAHALADKLAEEPVWLPAMLAAFRKEITRPGASIVFKELVDDGVIDEAQTGYWLDALMKAGRWDLARELWEQSLPAPPASPLYNGGFEQRPTSRGFDWRVGRQSGSYATFAPADGANGQAARLVFSGRPVARADLEQALALRPGRHELAMRLRAVALRSDQGLRWTVTCHGQSRPIGKGERLEGTFEWRTSAFDFEVPARDCPGQWLRLDNPAPRGSASSVSGELWVDNMVLSAPGAEPRSPVGP